MHNKFNVNDKIWCQIGSDYYYGTIKDYDYYDTDNEVVYYLDLDSVGEYKAFEEELSLNAGNLLKEELIRRLEQQPYQPLTKILREFEEKVHEDILEDIQMMKILWKRYVMF